MTFEEVLDQAIAMLQRRGRVTYRTLQRQFQLDDAALDDLKDALLYAHPQIHDDAGRGLVWTGDPSSAPRAVAAPTATPERPPLAYTPPYLAEKILVLWDFPECKIAIISTTYTHMSMQQNIEKSVKQCARPLRFPSTSPR